MSELKPYSPGAVFDEPHLVSPEETEQRFDNEALNIVHYWEETFRGIRGDTWERISTAVSERRRQMHQVLSEKYLSDRGLLSDLIILNETFGGISPFIRRQAVIYADRERRVQKRRATPEEREKVSQAYLGAAQWNGFAAIALGKLDEMPIGDSRQDVARHGPDILLPALHELFMAGLGQKEGDIEARRVISGLFGVLALADVADRAGYRSFIPPASWDAFNRIDLILTPEVGGGLLPRGWIMPTQVKSGTSGDPGIFMTAGTPSGEEQFEYDCRQISTLPGWSQLGLEIYPNWATITGAELGADAFSGLLSGEYAAAHERQLQAQIESAIEGGGR